MHRQHDFLPKTCIEIKGKIKSDGWYCARQADGGAAAKTTGGTLGFRRTHNRVLKPRAKLNRKEVAGISVAITLSGSTHPGIILMNPFILFFIRAILGVAIAVVITRMFRGEASVIYVAGLAAILVGLAYALEFYRKRNGP
jgi:hypothetical protein